MRSIKKSQAGFTLVEMIVVMVITGIIGAMVAIFIKAPVQGYMDSSRRAEMTDIADTAVRRLARDIRTAVPNSVRVATCGATSCVEFLPTTAGGRYRADQIGAAGVCGGSALGDALSFDAADTCFAIIGPDVTFTTNDWIVIGSTQSSGNPPYDNAGAGIRRQYTGAAGAQNRVVMVGAAQFPGFAEVQGQRFDVVPDAQQAVTYACLNTGTAAGEGTGTLTRYWHYNFNNSQVAPPIVGGSSAILADRVSDCAITYDAISQRYGLVTIRLGITRGGESVSLYQEIHVNNVP